MAIKQILLIVTMIFPTGFSLLLLFNTDKGIEKISHNFMKHSNRVCVYIYNIYLYIFIVFPYTYLANISLGT